MVKDMSTIVVLLESEYRSETSKFINDGYYDSCVGNLMPLSMANILHLSFVIIRPYTKPLYVTSEDNICHGTIFLVYQVNVKGHYDAELSSKQSDTNTTVTDSV